MGYTDLFIGFSKEIDKASKILLISHSKPDVDTLGSAISLYLYLNSISKTVDVLCKDSPSRDFDFLPSISIVKTEIKNFDYDLVITLDVGDLYMIGFNEEFFQNIKSVSFVNIDHHNSNSNFGNLNIVDSTAPSTTTILYDYFKFLNFSLNTDMATCLMAGLYSDTGSFKHSNTSAKAYEIASELMNLGAMLSDFSKILFNTKKVNSLKLWAKAFEKAYVSKDNVIVSSINKDDFEKTGTSHDSLSGVVEYLNMVPNTNYALLLSEASDHKIKGSFRTRNKNIDLSKIAQKYGGGGHPGASGFTVNGSLKSKNELTIFSEDMSKTLFSF